MRQTLLLATSNPGKADEFRRLLGDLVTMLSLVDVNVTMPDETGSTFQENAELKAVSAASQSGMMTLADDSGLVVDAMDGAPGIRSARFAGLHASDAENRTKLLGQLQHVPAVARGAHFVCALSLATPDGDVCTEMGVLRGAISETERGASGFGYDRLFELPDGQTLAELSGTRKNAVSHRAQAMHKMLPHIERVLRTSETDRS